MLFVRRAFDFTLLSFVSLIMLSCSVFFLVSCSLPLFLSWFLIITSICKGVWCICVFWSLWLGPSIYFFLFWFILSPIFFVNAFVNVSYPLIFFLMPLAYFIFVSTTFRLEVFKFYIFMRIFLKKIILIFY